MEKGSIMSSLSGRKECAFGSTFLLKAYLFSDLLKVGKNIAVRLYLEKMKYEKVVHNQVS